jgi:hypothetical protein
MVTLLLLLAAPHLTGQVVPCGTETFVCGARLHFQRPT